jgi:hypothetical protein
MTTDSSRSIGRSRDSRPSVVRPSAHEVVRPELVKVLRPQPICSVTPFFRHTAGGVLPFATGASIWPSRLTIWPGVCLLSFAIFRPFSYSLSTRTGTKQTGHSGSSHRRTLVRSHLHFYRSIPRERQFRPTARDRIHIVRRQKRQLVQNSRNGTYSFCRNPSFTVSVFVALMSF